MRVSEERRKTVEAELVRTKAALVMIGKQSAEQLASQSRELASECMKKIAEHSQKLAAENVGTIATAVESQTKLLRERADSVAKVAAQIRLRFHQLRARVHNMKEKDPKVYIFL